MPKTRPFEVRIGEQFVRVDGKPQNRVQVKLHLESARQAMDRYTPPRTFESAEVGFEKPDGSPIREPDAGKVEIHAGRCFESTEHAPDPTYFNHVEPVSELHMQSLSVGSARVLSDHGVASLLDEIRKGGEMGRSPRRHAKTAPVGSDEAVRPGAFPGAAPMKGGLRFVIAPYMAEAVTDRVAQALLRRGRLFRQDKLGGALSAFDQCLVTALKQVRV